MYFTRQDLKDINKDLLDFYYTSDRRRPEKEFDFFGNICTNKLSLSILELYQLCIYFEIPLKGPTKDIFKSLHLRAPHQLFHDPCECCKSTKVGIRFQNDQNYTDHEFLIEVVSEITDVIEYCHINQVVAFECSTSQNNKRLHSKELCVLQVAKCLSFSIDSGSVDVLSIIIHYYC